ncbi:zinc ribbon domain-containing protein [Sulfurovum sp.]
MVLYYRLQFNRKPQSKFECVACGLQKNADYNALVNILNAEGTTAKVS